tara:strand:- start:382 stop:594 length:213 start_codon:yes stop_codon:yes gene_type:complete
MSNFIDNKTIQSIIDEEVVDVKEIINTAILYIYMGIRTYRVEYINNDGDTQYHIIKNDNYNTRYKLLNDE